MSSEKSARLEPLVQVPATLISHLHTFFAYCAFLIALIVGCYTHYEKIVQNEFFGYPQEWFPSVSATTGDRFPARAIFQIFIALTSGPRFTLVYLWYLYSRGHSPRWAKALLYVGWTRTLSCGGWVYITSTDNHDVHDIAMITYLLLTIPWMGGCLSSTPPGVVGERSRTWRKLLCAMFFGSLVPMIYYFIQHKVHRVPGAYTTYAFFEWSLILYDVAFDAVTALDFEFFKLSIFDSREQSGITTSASASSTSIAASDAPPVVNEAKISRLAGDIRAFVTDIYLAFVFWSMLTSLALLIWYFPLWYMGISGYEAFLLVTVSPFLLGIPYIRNTVAYYRGYFHLLSLCGIASYKILDPAWRLAITAMGISISILTYAASWYSERNHLGRLEHNILVWALGLLVHNLVKLAWWTENPIWPIMYELNGGHNGIGFIIGVLACVNMILRDNARQQDKLLDREKEREFHVKEPWWRASVGLGAALFALHSMFTDSSTVMRWVVDGYPNYGPAPVPYGALTISALALGFFISTNRAVASSWTLYAIGCAACLEFYAFPAWGGYFGGLVLGAYFMAVTPQLIRSAVTHPPGRTFFAAMMVYNILCLAHVWVVAYAFVPAGELARERTNWVLASIMFFTGLGVWNANSFLSYNSKNPQFSIVKKTRRFGIYAAIAIVFLSIIEASMRVSRAKNPKPYHPNEKVFTAAIWTIHFALDNDMWASERRMSNVIADLELDVVGLLESDTQRIIMGNRDWAQYIAEDLGYFIDYGPATSKHTWGCLMLSKFPILRSTHHLLPSPKGELACAIHATLDVFGREVDFIVSHNGQEEDPLDRELQTKEISRIAGESKNPFVFLGYVVTKPNGHWYNILAENLWDVDTSDTEDRWCEYIFYRALRRIAYARVSHGDITDTEIQTAKFQVTSDKVRLTKPSYKRVPKESMPERLRYPDMFLGQGTRNHFYHVFDEPKYFD